MVGKEENAAKTLVRIEAIILQGLLMGLLLSAVGVALSPIVPVVVGCRRWRAERKTRHLATCLLLLPLWMLSGCFYAMLNPLNILKKTVADLPAVVAVEWKCRTEEGSPKKPNGHPLVLPTAEYRAAVDAAAVYVVYRDYFEEARESGQGPSLDGTLGG